MARAASSAQAAQRTAVLSYLGVYQASPTERINLIKRGISAAEAKRVLSDLAMGQGRALKALNLSPATVNKKAHRDNTLSTAESERVLGVVKLVGQLEAMVQESGNAEGFNAAAWISRWLQEPLAALGGERPIDLMDTMEGQALVSTALAQVQSGAYA